MTVQVVYDWSQWDKLEAGFDEIITLLPGALEGAVEEMGLFLERESKISLTESGGVQTGRLRASIGHGPEGIWKMQKRATEIVVTVGSNVEYAAYVEHGFTMTPGRTVHIPGVGFRFVHPFTFEGYHYMRTAAEALRPQAPLIVERHVMRAFEQGLGGL